MEADCTNMNGECFEMFIIGRLPEFTPQPRTFALPALLDSRLIESKTVTRLRDPNYEATVG